MDESAQLPLWILQAGVVAYADAWHLQRRLREARRTGLISDTLLLLEHPPTVTLGRGAGRENLLISEEELRGRGISLYHTDRGGDVTYHGPGQVVGYPILDLRARHLSVARYLSQLEEVVLRTLSDHGIVGSRRAGLIGIWIGARKVASIGIRVSRGITSHGFALNVMNDLLPFTCINPCGMPETEMTSVSRECTEAVALSTVQALLSRHFQVVFGFGHATIDTLQL